MAEASYARTNFTGGEWSQAYLGRFDLPSYKTSLAICYNGLPAEEGYWTRRPGLNYGSITRLGQPARIDPFAFQQQLPATLEWTPGYLRFYVNGTLATSNDDQAVTALSSASPASATVAASYSTGAAVRFKSVVGSAAQYLLHRHFIWTYVDSTHGTLVDAFTGTAINGSAIGTFTSGVIQRIYELTTVYAGSDFLSLRVVQTDGGAICLHGTYAPQVLTVLTTPTLTTSPTFTLSPANFVDGPYLDPPTNNAQVTPSAKTGLVNIVVSFPAYVSSTVYAKNQFVTASGTSYQSLVDQNLGNTPASSPTYWNPVAASIAIGPNGFQGSDVGRHVRLLSEPPLWSSASVSYTAGNVVKYLNSSGDFSYWTCLTNNTSSAINGPGLSSTNWGINAAGSTWSWGKITALLNQIAQSPSGIARVGDMTAGGGLAAAFDTNLTKAGAACASTAQQGFSTTYLGVVTLSNYVGQDYHSCSPTAQAVASVTLVPSTDWGFALLYGPQSGTPSTPLSWQGSGTFNLYGSNSAPSNATNGTLLGSTTVPVVSKYGNVIGNFNPGQPFNPGPVNIQSNDQVTTWKYVWTNLTISMQMTSNVVSGVGVFYMTPYVSQMEIFSPTSGTSSSGVTVELLGPDLLYTTPITTWRLGLYTNSANGWPTCGTYHEGRLFLGGSVNNRFDGSQPDQMWSQQISFAPTAYDGTVADDNAISYTLNAPDSNTIQWFKPDLQGIIVGTEKGEWLVTATTQNLPLTPTSIQAHRVTRIGSSVVTTAEPVQCEHTTVFIHRHARKIMEYFADVFSGKFTAPNIAVSAAHLTAAQVVRLAYQQSLTPVIWGQTLAGALIGCTYKRDSLFSSQGPTFAGWHRHALGSGYSIGSLCVGPSPDGTCDTLAVVAVPPASVTAPCQVQFMNKLFEETDVLTSASFLDSAISPVVTIGSTSLTLTGLWPLNGTVATAFVGGLDCGDYTVTNGQIVVPFISSNPLLTAAYVASFPTLPAVVGYTYTSQGQISPPVEPAETGARNGPGFGKLKKDAKVAIKLVNTQGISFGPTFDKLHAAILRTPGLSAVLPMNTLFSGIYRDNIASDHSLEGKVAWQITRPYPASVCVVGGFVDTSDI